MASVFSMRLEAGSPTTKDEWSVLRDLRRAGDRKQPFRKWESESAREIQKQSSKAAIDHLRFVIMHLKIKLNQAARLCVFLI